MSTAEQLPRFHAIDTHDPGFATIVDRETGVAAELLGVPCVDTARGDVPYLIECLELQVRTWEQRFPAILAAVEVDDLEHLRPRVRLLDRWWVTSIAAPAACALAATAVLAAVVLL